jgi:hypothetical protein
MNKIQGSKWITIKTRHLKHIPIHIHKNITIAMLTYQQICDNYFCMVFWAFSIRYIALRHFDVRFLHQTSLVSHC